MTEDTHDGKGWTWRNPPTRTLLIASGILGVSIVAGGYLLGDGVWEGAACWRADGTVIALGGGLARDGVRFRPEL